MDSLAASYFVRNMTFRVETGWIWEYNHSKISLYWRTNTLKTKLKRIYIILKQLLSKIIFKYLLCYFVSLILFLTYKKVGNIEQQSILKSIMETLISLPIIFIVDDLYNSFFTLKAREKIDLNLNSRISTIFLRFIYFSTLFYRKFELQENYNVFNLNNELEKTPSDIFNLISDNVHPGFFIFSDFDQLDNDMEEILSSDIVIKYMKPQEISVLYDFINKYNTLVDSFRIITESDFIHFQNISNLYIEKSHTITSTSGKQVYDIGVHDSEGYKALFGAPFTLFEEKPLMQTYKLSGTKAKEIADEIYDIYETIKKWQTIKKIKAFDIPTGMIISHRLYLGNFIKINKYMDNSVSFNGSFN